MNSSERHLRDELARAAGQAPDSSVSLDDLRAGSSHRGRTVLLAAAAALVAIALPVTVIELSSDDGSKPPVTGTPTDTPSTASPTPEPSPTYSPVGDVVLDPSEAPTDVRPGVPVGVRGSVDGVPLDLAKSERLVSFAPHGAGWIALVADNQGELEVRLVAPDGTVTGLGWTNYSWFLAAADDGSVAYVNRDHELQLDGPDGNLVQTWALPSKKIVVLSGVLPDGTVALREEGVNPRALFANPDGTLTTVDGIIQVGGVSPDGSVAALVSISDAGSCSAVVNPVTGEQAWKTCDYTLSYFSPDGRLVIGKPAYLDGIGDSSVSILDARTGQVLVDFQGQRDPWGYISGSVWEDDTHLLTSYYSSEGGWHVLRLGVDGSVTIADLGSLGGGELNNPVTLPAQS